MVPLLYRNLHATYPEAVPGDVLVQLRDYFQANAQRNLFRTQELLKLLSLLEGQGVTAVPLKGPILTASVYGNLAFRQFCDLDILVRERDVLKARDLIASQGYRPAMQSDRAQEPLDLQSQRELVLKRDDGQVQVDLQWRIPADWLVLRSFPLGRGRLWERLEPFSIAGTTLSTFSPQDLLLILCVHGASHGWRHSLPFPRKICF
jgi:hypothetical protein